MGDSGSMTLLKSPSRLTPASLLPREGPWDFPGSGPVVKTLFPKQGARVQSLVGELRSHVPCDDVIKKRERERESE